jgi:hypothetical protein
MARGRTQKNLVSFNAGELSPLLDARVDLDKYSNGCRQLQNAIIETYGAARRRPGLQFVAEAKYPTNPGDSVRLIEFQFSTTTTFVLELGNAYMRFFSNGAPVMDGVNPYEITTPWEIPDLYGVKYAQINDVMYLVHPLYPVYKLSRVADTNWTCEEVDFARPALLDENATDITLTPSGTTGTITVTATGGTPFVADMVGSIFQISYLRTDTNIRKNITSNGNSASNLRVVGEWRLRTSGTWDAEVNVERSYDGGTNWELVRVVESASDSNYDTTGIEVSDAIYRIRVANYSSSSSSPRAILEIVDPYGRGYVEVTGFTSSSVVSGTVLTAKGLFGVAATRYWAEGAWSEYRGYPTAVSLFEQRICFAGTAHQPQTVWGSAAGDYENFDVGTSDTDAFAYTIGAQERNAIQWLVAQKALLIGTTSGEWSMQGGNDSALTATNVSVRRQSNYGSKAVQARLVNEVVLFTQRQGLKVREMTYSFERDGYVAPDLTLLAEHITAGGIVQMAYQQQNQSILWAVTGDGMLVGMTYERDQSVVGWHRHVTDGLFKSVVTVYGDGADEVWCVVKRTVNGVAKNYIERFNPVVWENLEDAFYVDSGLSYDGSATTTFSGLDHLKGKTVAVLADGAPVADKVVSSTGVVTLDAAASVVHIGLPYETVVEPMRIDSDPNAGVSQGQVKQIRELVVRLNQSLGLSYGDGVTFRTLSFRDTSDDMDAAPPLFTGDKEIEFDGAFELDSRLVIKQTQPLPLCLLAIVVKYAITGD